MLVLALDTATPAVSVALVELADQATDAASRRWVDSASWQRIDGKRHGELLATGIHELLAQEQRRPQDLGAIAVGLGPGPFTGLRVGIVTAAALSDALAIPAYGVCSLDAVGAWGDEAGRRLVVTDARRREVYWAEYAEDGERLAGPEVLAPAELARRLRETQWPAPETGGRVVGDGALLHRELFAGFDVRADERYPSADALVLLAAGRILAGAEPAPLTPLYLRRPDAVQPGAPKRVTA